MLLTIYIYCTYLVINTLFYSLNLIISIIVEQYLTFVEPLRRFYYPDTWLFINAYIIMLLPGEMCDYE